MTIKIIILFLSVVMLFSCFSCSEKKEVKVGAIEKKETKADAIVETKAEATLYILKNSEEASFDDGVETIYEDFKHLLKTNTLLLRVSERLKAENDLDVTVEELRDCLDCEHPEDTRIITVSCKNDIGSLALTITDIVCIEVEALAEEVYGYDVFNIFENSSIVQ